MNKLTNKKNDRGEVLKNHRSRLRQHFTVPATIRSALSADELKHIEKYGCWFKALQEGTLECLTGAQEHFVEVSRGKAAPNTFSEHVWSKYVEMETKMAMNATQAQYTSSHGGTGANYGAFSNFGLSNKGPK